MTEFKQGDKVSFVGWYQQSESQVYRFAKNPVIGTMIDYWPNEGQSYIKTDNVTLYVLVHPGQCTLLESSTK